MKHLTVSVAALLLLLAAVSCGEAKNHPAETKDSAEPSVSGTQSGALTDLPSDLDFGQAEFRILSRQTACSVFHDGPSSDTVEDAVYRRNIQVEEALNVKIVEERYSTCELEVLPDVVMADEHVYDAVMTHITKMTEFAQKGYFVEVGDVKYLDLSKPYWTGSVTDTLRIMGRDYLFTGDIATSDDANIWCIYFNKNLIKELNLESPYKAVDEGRWTLDYYAASAKEGAADLDADGKWSWDADRFAVLNPTETLCGMFNTMGQHAVTVGSDGGMNVQLDSEASLNVLTKISEWASSGKGTIFLEAVQIPKTTMWQDLQNVFCEGRALYYMQTVHVSSDAAMRAMVPEFGILPTPKLDEAQKKYTSAVQEWGQCVYGIPVIAPDTDRSGAVLEMMSACSTDTLRTAFFDVALTRKYSRDEESVRMLEILYNNIEMDIGFSYYPKIRNEVNTMLAQGGTVASSVESILSTLNANIAGTEEAFSAIGQK